jgi:hypothetical protein
MGLIVPLFLDTGVASAFAYRTAVVQPLISAIAVSITLPFTTIVRSVYYISKRVWREAIDAERLSEHFCATASAEASHESLRRRRPCDPGIEGPRETGAAFPPDY